MKGMKSLAMLAALSMMGGSPFATEINEIDLSKKEPPIPKGCEKYRFDARGNWCTDKNINRIQRNDIVYTCIARTTKKAIEKFEKNYKPKLS